MKKLNLYIAMSLDGYLADSKGGVSWLQGQDPHNEELGGYADFIEGIDTVLMGFKTYHQITSELAVNAWPYEGKQSYVFTHCTKAPEEGVVFTQEDPVKLVQGLKQEAGKDIWLCGGAALVNQLRAEIDVFRVSVIPYILGQGIPLFAPQETQQALRLVETQATNGIVELHYVRR